MSQQQVKQYQRNQDEADRQKMLEKTKDFTFINLMLKAADTDEHRNQQANAKVPVNNKPANAPRKDERTPEQLLHAFTEYALKASLHELELAWKSADRSLVGNPLHEKALAVYLDRKSEIEGEPA